MTDTAKKTSTARTKAWRQRQRAADPDLATGEPRPCQLCDAMVCLNKASDARKASPIGQLVCGECWRRTRDGRAAERARRSFDRAQARARREGQVEAEDPAS